MSSDKDATLTMTARPDTGRGSPGRGSTTSDTRTVGAPRGRNRGGKRRNRQRPGKRLSGFEHEFEEDKESWYREQDLAWYDEIPEEYKGNKDAYLDDMAAIEENDYFGAGVGFRRIKGWDDSASDESEEEKVPDFLVLPISSKQPVDGEDVEAVKVSPPGEKSPDKGKEPDTATPKPDAADKSPPPNGVQGVTGILSASTRVTSSTVEIVHPLVSRGDQVFYTLTPASDIRSREKTCLAIGNAPFSGPCHWPYHILGKDRFGNLPYQKAEEGDISTRLSRWNFGGEADFSAHIVAGVCKKIEVGSINNVDNVDWLTSQGIVIPRRNYNDYREYSLRHTHNLRPMSFCSGCGRCLNMDRELKCAIKGYKGVLLLSPTKTGMDLGFVQRTLAFTVYTTICGCDTKEYPIRDFNSDSNLSLYLSNWALGRLYNTMYSAPIIMPTAVPAKFRGDIKALQSTLGEDRSTWMVRSVIERWVEQESAKSVVEDAKVSSSSTESLDDTQPKEVPPPVEPGNQSYSAREMREKIALLAMFDGNKVTADLKKATMSVDEWFVLKGMEAAVECKKAAKWMEENPAITAALAVSSATALAAIIALAVEKAKQLKEEPTKEACVESFLEFITGALGIMMGASLLVGVVGFSANTKMITLARSVTEFIGGDNADALEEIRRRWTAVKIEHLKSSMIHDRNSQEYADWNTRNGEIEVSLAHLDAVIAKVKRTGKLCAMDKMRLWIADIKFIQPEVQSAFKEVIIVFGVLTGIFIATVTAMGVTIALLVKKKSKKEAEVPALPPAPEPSETPASDSPEPEPQKPPEIVPMIKFPSKTYKGKEGSKVVDDFWSLMNNGYTSSPVPEGIDAETLVGVAGFVSMLTLLAIPIATLGVVVDIKKKIDKAATAEFKNPEALAGVQLLLESQLADPDELNSLWMYPDPDESEAKMKGSAGRRAAHRNAQAAELKQKMYNSYKAQVDQLVDHKHKIIARLSDIYDDCCGEPHYGMWVEKREWDTLTKELEDLSTQIGMYYDSMEKIAGGRASKVAARAASSGKYKRRKIKNQGPTNVGSSAGRKAMGPKVTAEVKPVVATYASVVTKPATHSINANPKAVEAPRAAPVSVGVVKRYDPRNTTKENQCATCHKHHKMSTCRWCKHKHCFSNPCEAFKKRQKVEPVEKTPGVEAITPQPTMSVSALQNTPLRINQGHGLISNGVRVTFSKEYKLKPGAYLLVCAHQIQAGADLEIGNEKFVLPKLEQWERPFKDPDLACLNWDYFKGRVPVAGIQTWKVEPRTPTPQANFTLVTRNPVTGLIETAGVTDYRIQDGRFFYSVSTSNGSCGSPLIMTSGGQFTVHAIHNGTVGTSSTRPNYGLLLDPKNC